MAINTKTFVTISGAASNVLATAISNGNAAIATFFANSQGSIWNPAYQPIIMNSGLNADAGNFTAWWTVQYQSAS